MKVAAACFDDSRGRGNEEVWMQVFLRVDFESNGSDSVITEPVNLVTYKRPFDGE